MKKIFKYSINLIIILTFILPVIVNANIICNDGTRSPSCSDCHRGCCSHHGGCTNGSSSSSSSSSKTTVKKSSGSSSSKKKSVKKSNNSSKSSSNSTKKSNTQQQVKKVISKSSDVSLKQIKVDEQKIDILDNMTYKTTKKNIKLSVIANDSKATISYDKNIALDIGNNMNDIKVTAQNGKVKIYKLNIIREKIVSNSIKDNINLDLILLKIKQFIYLMLKLKI